MHGEAAPRFDLRIPQNHAGMAPLLEKAGGLRRELELLRSESDPRLFSEGLFRLAEREEARENIPFAIEAFAWIQAHGDSAVSVAAQKKLSTMRGEGSFGERAEGLLRRFAQEAGDPATLLAMAAAGGVYRGTRLAVMSRLSGSAGWFGRGAGLRFAGGIAGLVAEAPVFTTVARLGHGMEPFGAGWGEELKSAYLVLGGLKSMDGVSKRLFRGVENAKVRSLLAYGGMYGGIMTGHGLETVFGMREWNAGGAEWVEGLATLLQFKVSGDLLARAGGMRRREIERKWALAEENPSAGIVRAANDGAYPPIEPAANGPHRRVLEQTWALAAGGELWSRMESLESTGRPRFFVLASQGEDSGGGDVPKSEPGVKSDARQGTAGKTDAPREEASSDRSLEELSLSESKGPQPPPSAREVRAAFAQLNSMLKGHITVNSTLLRESEGILRRFFQARPMNQFAVEDVAVTAMVQALKLGTKAGGELGAACQGILAADRVLGPYLAIRKHWPGGLGEAD